MGSIRESYVLIFIHYKSKVLKLTVLSVAVFNVRCQESEMPNKGNMLVQEAMRAAAEVVRHRESLRHADTHIISSNFLQLDHMSLLRMQTVALRS